MEATKTKETFESRTFFDKAEASIKRGNFAEAAQLLKEALKISPDNPTYISSLGLCIGMQGNIFVGEKMCRQALAMSQEKDPILYVNIGKVVLEDGRRKEARKNFMSAYRLDNTNAPAALELSRMGVRKSPVLPFLSRKHPLNVTLGKIRHRLRQMRSPEMKKL